MCGIFFCASRNGVDVEKHGPLLARLDKRGPDSQKFSHANVLHSGEEIHLAFYSTVLSLRGSDVTVQPLVDQETLSQLCWNGEAWSINASTVLGNDAASVFQMLLAAMNKNDEEKASPDDPVITAVNTIVGPFAFVLYDAIHARVYFGRDALGRRSLLVKSNDEGLYLSSIGDGTSGWAEVPADGIYVVHFDEDDPLRMAEHSSESNIISFPYSYCFHFSYNHYGKYHPFNHSIPSHDVSALSLHSEAVSELDKLLQRSLLTRTENIPYRITPRTVTSTTANGTGENIADGEQQGSNHIDHESNSPDHQLVTNPRLAVLFSGGLDCTVLARQLHDILPPNEGIDLLNVAFHNPRVHGILNVETVFESCPDRITAKASLAELKEVCPGRLWRLVEINIPYDEMLEHREQVVSLMHPHDTEMDLSIALALYFAARGVGVVHDDNGEKPQFYETSSRVLFSGLGADELFGGYQRHATAHSRQGFKGLLDELELDINRLGQRNLGRDDRVISHWSKEARYPFLDEDLVKWAVMAPVWYKCGFGLPENNDNHHEAEHAELDIESGKKVLRLLALKLNMKNVAREKKRAIQFGARTAKMLVGKSKGTQRIA